MNKHTSGPWAVDLVTGAIWYDDRGDGDVRPVIATVRFDNTEYGQFEADCHLIAAAPDLLAALANPAGLDDGALAGMDARALRDLIREYRTEARTAIAKAKGA